MEDKIEFDSNLYFFIFGDLCEFDRRTQGKGPLEPRNSLVKLII
jgi:hypothetical protein